MLRGSKVLLTLIDLRKRCVMGSMQEPRRLQVDVLVAIDRVILLPSLTIVEIISLARIWLEYILESRRG
jgi:hypothetical protein